MFVLYIGEDFLLRVFEKLLGVELVFFIEYYWLYIYWGIFEFVLDLFCCLIDFWLIIDCFYRWSV